jgi:hypothetical protein
MFKAIEGLAPKDDDEIKRDADPGAHYRVKWKIKLTEQNKKDGYVIVQVDPARIAKLYGLTSHMLFFVLKKCLKAGARGYKGYRQDILDSKNALDRELEMLAEDGEI